VGLRVVGLRVVGPQVWAAVLAGRAVPSRTWRANVVLPGGTDARWLAAVREAAAEQEAA
jgi:hypothetical protein